MVATSKRCPKCTGELSTPLRGYIAKLGTVGTRAKCTQCPHVEPPEKADIPFKHWDRHELKAWCEVVGKDLEDGSVRCPDCRGMLAIEEAKQFNVLVGWRVTCANANCGLQKQSVPRSLPTAVKRYGRALALLVITLAAGAVGERLRSGESLVPESWSSRPSVGLRDYASEIHVSAASTAKRRRGVVLVGSGTALTALRCSVSLRTSFAANPPRVILIGGTVTGNDIARESQSHGRRDEPDLDVLGFAAGRPRIDDLQSRSPGAENEWVLLPVEPDYPLGVLMGADVGFSSERDCSLGTGIWQVNRCISPNDLRNLIGTEERRRAEHLERALTLLVPDARGGTRRAFDAALWGEAARAPQLWQNPDSEFTLDFGEVGPKALAIGLPTYDSQQQSCLAPKGIRRLGLCVATDAAKCEPTRLGIFSYFRIPRRCGSGASCSAPPAICSVLRDVFPASSDGFRWAEDGCRFNFTAHSGGVGLTELKPIPSSPSASATPSASPSAAR